MGVINVAMDEEVGRQVAIKQIRPEMADHEAYRQKFQQEGEITGNLEHPGIVPVYGLGTDADGRPYYAMGLVKGENLASCIQRFHEQRLRGDTGFDSVAFHGLIDRFIDVVQAISYAHSRGVLHRDLKPGNILLGRFGESLVIDWGLARPNSHLQEVSQEEQAMTDRDGLELLQVRSGSDAAQTEEGAMLGTLGYAPPEQITGAANQISERSDVYSLCAILYHILTGQMPVSTKNREASEVMADTVAGRIARPRDLNRRIPRPLQSICMRLAQRSDDRYASARDLIDELERWKADQPVQAYRDSWWERLSRLGRRHQVLVRTAGVTLIAITVVAVAAAFAINKQQRLQKEQAQARGAARARLFGFRFP